MANGLDPYTLPVHVGQTLLWPVWLVISYVISGLVPFGSPFVYIGIIKLAPIAADLLLPFVVIKAIESLSGVGTSLQNKTRIVKLILLNPLLILASSFWAMTDSIAVLLILLSFIAVSKNRIVVSSIFVALSFSLKLYPIVFVPPIGLVLIWKHRSLLHASLFSVLTALTSAVIAFGPFFIFQWNINLFYGVFGSQLVRLPGGIAPFGAMAALTADNPFSDIFIQIYSFLNSLLVFRLLWIIGLFIVTVLLLIRRPPESSISWRKNESIPFSNVRDDNVFSLLPALCLLYFFIWFLLAPWVSEQNFVTPLIILLVSSYVRLSREDIQSEATRPTEMTIYSKVTALVSIFAFLNVPFPAFFFLFLEALDFLIYNPILRLIRAVGLFIVSLVLLTTVIKFYFSNRMKDRFHESAMASRNVP